MSNSRTSKPSYGMGKQAIIEAAIQLVAREGLTKLTYRSLAKEAKITTGAVQHHFKTMDDVLSHALEYLIIDAQNSSVDIKSIEEFGELFVQLLKDKPEMQIFWVEVMTAARLNPSLLYLVDRYQELYRQLSREMLQNLRIEFDDDLIEFIVSTIDGVLLQFLVSGKTKPDRILILFKTLLRVISNYKKISY